MIPIAKPELGEEEAEAARLAVLSNWVTQGPQVAAFEKEFAALVGAPYACAVSNCTNALHLALLAVGVGPGDEVITVSHSFIATANAVRYCGAIPVFVDIEADTFNMDPQLVAAAITPKTKAVMCVHQIGMPCDLDALLAVTRAHGLPLVEDAACAIGSVYIGQDGPAPIGRPHGDIACFSLHPRKIVTTGDGGMITTSNAAFDRQFRLLRQHSMSVPDTIRHGASEVIFEAYPVVGYNYRMTDIQAAVGRPQLKRLQALVERRRAIVDQYTALLGNIEGLSLPFEPPYAHSNWQSYCVRLPDGCDQRIVMQRLLDDGVASRRGIMCAHREAAFADLPLRHPLPQSEAAQDHCIILPLYGQMTSADLDRVASSLSSAIRLERR